MEKQKHTVDPEKLHQMGQGDSQKVSNDFIHTGIPDKLVDYSSMPNGMKPAGTAALRSNLENQNEDVVGKVSPGASPNGK